MIYSRPSKTSSKQKQRSRASKQHLVALALTAAAIAVASCGGEDQANEARPPAPVQVSVSLNYVAPEGDQIGIEGADISASPSEVGAGPINFVVSNESGRELTFKVTPGNVPDESEQTVGPIPSGGTADLLLDLKEGSYTLGTTSAEVKTAVLEVGSNRESSDDQLLLP